MGISSTVGQIGQILAPFISDFGLMSFPLCSVACDLSLGHFFELSFPCGVTGLSKTSTISEDNSQHHNMKSISIFNFQGYFVPKQYSVTIGASIFGFLFYSNA